MAKRGWKAVFRKGSRYFSIFIGNENEQSEYIEGETTRRKEGFGPLTCFETEEQAQDLAQRLYGNKHHRMTAVLPCEFEKSKDTNIWTPNTKGLIYRNFPVGTRLADSITILKPGGN